MKNWVIFTDGGSRGNPGNAAAAFVVLTNEETVFQQGKFLGEHTNNVAEYQAFIASVIWVLQQQAIPHTISWFLDSKLVVEQISGHWKIKEPHLRVLQQQCLTLLAKLPKQTTYTINHVPREKNRLADALVNQVLDKQ